MLVVRKSVRFAEDVVREQGQDLQVPYRVAIAAVVIENPFSLGFTRNVSSLADRVGRDLGLLVGPVVVEMLGGQIEAFGKAVLVGLDGELEHGSALIHNLLFGNIFREAAGGTELLPSAEKRAGAGATIDIPLKHKLRAETRSHHQTVTLQIPDSPHPREIVVACAGANRGRPLARLAAFGAEVEEASNRA